MKTKKKKEEVSITKRAISLSREGLSGEREGWGMRLIFIAVIVGITLSGCTKEEEKEEEKKIPIVNVDSSSLVFSAKNETKTITVKANTEWTVSIPTSCNWIVSVTPQHGTGDAVINVTVDENISGTQRNGNLTLYYSDGSVNVNISQAKTPVSCTLTANPGSGNAPLLVDFVATTSNVSELSSYEIDFDGDGVFDYKGVNGSVQYTYTKAGVYNVKLQVTDKQGFKGVVTLAITVREIYYSYPGYATLKFAKGIYWKYRWSTTSKTDGKTNAPKNGYFTITLGDPISLYYENNIGALDCYKATWSLSGDAPSWFVLQKWDYLAVKEGVLYGIKYNTSDGLYYANTLFNSQNGNAAPGFMGYFWSSRKSTIDTGYLESPFNTSISGIGVRIWQMDIKSLCETIAGITLCGSESYDDTFREYYMQGIGFCGFQRYGSAAYYSSFFTSLSYETNVWIVETNINRNQ